MIYTCGVHWRVHQTKHKIDQILSSFSRYLAIIFFVCAFTQAGFNNEAKYWFQLHHFISLLEPKYDDVKTLKFLILSHDFKKVSPSLNFERDIHESMADPLYVSLRSLHPNQIIVLEYTFYVLSIVQRKSVCTGVYLHNLYNKKTRASGITRKRKRKNYFSESTILNKY